MQSFSFFFGLLKSCRQICKGRRMSRVGGVLCILLAASCNVNQGPHPSSSMAAFPPTAVNLSAVEYGIANPDCEMWSDWQKLCSRTGESGSVFCVDSQVEVPPSATFCVARSGEPYSAPSGSAGARELASYNRFCEEFSSVADGKAQCVRWSPMRPFNGLRLQEREHPWCGSWVSAMSPDVNRQLSEMMGFGCAAPRVPDWCTWPEGLGGRPDLSDDEPVLAIGPKDPSSVAIVGVYCRRNENGR